MAETQSSTEGSTSRVLSQNEIDALLGGLTEGVIGTDPGPEGADEANDAVVFNFVNQHRIVRGEMPTLEVVHERFARLLRTGLTQMVRRSVEVNVIDHEQMKYGDFSRSIPVPASLHVMKMPPLKGQALLVLPGKLIYTLLDIFFGGSGDSSEKGTARDFTLIEQRIIADLIGVIDKNYSEAWRPVYSLEVELASSETNLRFINVAKLNDVVTQVDYEILIDENRCAMTICIPYRTIEPIKDTLKGSVISESLDPESSWAEPLTEHLMEAVVEVKAMLGSSTITVQELLNLKIGDVIQLEEDYEHPLELLIEGVTKFWGVGGSHKCVRAVQITGVEDEGERKSYNV